MTQVPISYYSTYTSRSGSISKATWKTNMDEMIKHYLSGKPVYLQFTKTPRRIGSIGRLKITNMQDVMHGQVANYYSRDIRTHIPETLANWDSSKAGNVILQGTIVWDKRSNKIAYSSYDYQNDLVWLKDHKEEDGTKWVWAKPNDPPAIKPIDKLGSEINVGDFISYVLYNFDNSGNSAGIYYGKVTKISNDGQVTAKNIKLSENDLVAEKRIKDNSLIVIMSKDIMDKLMLARMSVL